MPDHAPSVIAAISQPSSEASELKPSPPGLGFIASRLPAAKQHVIATVSLLSSEARRLLPPKQSRLSKGETASPNRWLAVTAWVRPVVATVSLLSGETSPAQRMAGHGRLPAAKHHVIATVSLLSSEARRLLPPKQSRVVLALCLTLILFSIVACARGSTQLNGWNALQPDMELRSEPGRGQNGEPVLALLYALVPGTEYGIERQMPIPGLEGRPSLRLMAKASRVLYLAVVLLDSAGQEHKGATVLEPGDWRTLEFDTFEPAVADWSQITAVRFMDYTGLLIGQGSVSLKLVGLPQ